MRLTTTILSWIYGFIKFFISNIVSNEACIDDSSSSSFSNESSQSSLSNLSSLSSFPSSSSQSSQSSQSSLSSQSSKSSILSMSSNSSLSINDNGPEKQKRIAVIVSIMDYPGTTNDLTSDMHYNMDLFENILKNRFDFVTIRLKDSQATRNSIRDTIIKNTQTLNNGDAFVFAYSGHGMTLPDSETTGQIDELDGKDEVLFTYDVLWRDDHIRETIDNIPEGVKITFVVESCFSGTITRKITKKKNKNRNIPETSMREILFSSSKANEYSWPEYFSKRGYFSNALIKALDANSNNITANQLYREITSNMRKAGASQTPQLEGPDSLKNDPIFV